MKKKLLIALTGLLCAFTIGTVATPATSVNAAPMKLTNGTTVEAIPIAGFVATGTTADLMVLDTAAGKFNVKLDATTNYGATKYLSTGEIVVVDIYAGNDAAFHAANFQLNTVNQPVAGSVAVGADKVAKTAAAPTTVSVPQNTVQVTGTVDANTTNTMLYLSTSDGVMQIKLDAATDQSDAKVLIPGYKYLVNIYNGGDGYNHAAKIIDTSGNNVGSGAGLGSQQVTVPGTVMKGTVQNTLYLSTAGGNMIIKIDRTSDTSNCRVLKEGQKIEVTVAGGPDGYLHIISARDQTPKTVKEGSMGDNGKLTDQQTFSVNGTVRDDSTDDVLNFATNDGQLMKLRLDSGSKGTNAAAFRPGSSYNVNVYRGSDAYNHVASYTETSSGSGAGNGNNVNRNAQQNFTGTVLQQTTNNVLHLRLSDGSVVQIKLDVTTNSAGCPILRNDRKINVQCGYGSDGYWHAMTITRT